MAILKQDSSKRRRSIAVPSQNRQAIASPTGRRRAHSIVPGERLNGLDKLRRSSFAPRKSILKPSPLINTEDGSELPSNSQSSQPSQPDDANVTQSMDFTVDYHAPVHDNTSRKSMGRRVSFAEHAHVRLFQIPKHDNTNSTGSPQSSPILSSPETTQQPSLSNENDYPASFSRRRSSARFSIAGSEDMDLTTANPGALYLGDEGSALMDQEMEFDDNDDMDVTEVLRGDLARRRSSVARQPFAPVRPRDSIVFPSDDAIPSDDDNSDQTQSTIQENSQVHSETAHSQEGMEFTVPMGQSLRPPPTEDPVWLALRQMTHSGHTAHEPEVSEESIQVNGGQQAMDLNDAMARLMRARDSMGTSNGESTDSLNVSANAVVQEDSFLSTDDSLNDEVADGDETLNISRIIGRHSLGADARMSLGYQDSTMDESGIYGSIQPLPSSTPRPSVAPLPQVHAREEPPTETQRQDDSDTPRPFVFQPPLHEVDPPNSAITAEKETITPPTFTFVPPLAAPAAPQNSRIPTKSVSPAKLKSKPTFSAAFAPPVAKPSPRRPSTSTIPDRGTPSKRPFSVMQDGAHAPERPSPAKRPALMQASGGSSTPKKGPTFSQPKTIVSPNKSRASNGTSDLPGKRQSGYFARRKSLGNALTAPRDDPREGNLNSVSPAQRITNGRASLGSALSEGRVRFDNNLVPPSITTVVLPTEPAEEDNAPLAPNLASGQLSPTSSTAPKRISPPLSQTSDELDTQPVVDGQPMQRSNEGQLEAQDEEDLPSISIQEFFSMTGIKFMDELTAPRRSVHPHTGTHQARSPEEIPLSEYYITMGIDVPQLSLFTRVSKDLEGWMARSKTDFAQAEEEAAKITPELFVEFMRADEEGQAELMHQLNLIRVNTRGQAKSDWYDWKLRWVQGLQTTAEQAFNDLQADATILEPIKQAAEELVPTLEKEYNDILGLLEREQAEVAEIEESDQDYLNDLKVSIAEQNIEVEALRAELSEHTEQLNYLQGRLEELTIGKKEAGGAIAKAQRILQMKENSTRTEVFRLRDELEALEDLHRFHITKVDEAIFEYVHASHFKVTIPCLNYLPIASRVDITRLDGATRTKDDFPKLSNIMLQATKVLVQHSRPKSCKEIVHHLSDYWSSCSQLRAQLRLLSIKYPIDILPWDCDGVPAFRVRTKVIIPGKKAKIFVTFNFTPDVFYQWPLSIGSLAFDVEIGYGSINQRTAEQAVSGRLSQATTADNYACLLDACIEAQEICNQ